MKNDLNPIKTKFSKAYLHAVAAKANLILDEKHLDVDSLGIDFSVYKQPPNDLQGQSISNEVKIQLKGTSVNSKSMLKENENSYVYSLDKKLIRYGNMYLIVVIMPTDTDIETWFSQNKNELIIRKCGYYKRMETDLERGSIVLPKTSLLTPESMLNMFEIDKNIF